GGAWEDRHIGPARCLPAHLDGSRTDPDLGTTLRRAMADSRSLDTGRGVDLLSSPDRPQLGSQTPGRRPVPAKPTTTDGQVGGEIEPLLPRIWLPCLR